MKYGAKYLQWAKEKALEGGYEKAMSLGALQKVTEEPEFAEGKGFGDNAMKVTVRHYQECKLDIEVTKLPREAASAVLGAKLDMEPEGKKNIHYNEGDNPPVGGLAFFYSEYDDNSVPHHIGVFYPKVKASMGGTEYTTAGESIQLTGEKLQMAAMTGKDGDWRICSEEFATEAEAKKWVDECFAPAAGVPGA